MGINALFIRAFQALICFGSVLGSTGIVLHSVTCSWVDRTSGKEWLHRGPTKIHVEVLIYHSGKLLPSAFIKSSFSVTRKSGETSVTLMRDSFIVVGEKTARSMGSFFLRFSVGGEHHHISWWALEAALIAQTWKIALLLWRWFNTRSAINAVDSQLNNRNIAHGATPWGILRTNWHLWSNKPY